MIDASNPAVPDALPPQPAVGLGGTTPYIEPAAVSSGAAIIGERHVSDVAGRAPRLSKRAGLTLLAGAGTLAVAFVALHGSTAQPIKPPVDKLEVKQQIKFDGPPDTAPPLPPELASASMPAPPVVLGEAPPLPTDPIQPSMAGIGAGRSKPVAAKDATTRPPDRLLVYTSGSANDPRSGGAGGQAGSGGTVGAGGGAEASELGARLQSTKLTGASANLLRNQPYMLTTGNVLPCVLQTAMDSTLPGLVTCIIPQDVLGKTGLTLLDRGTRVVGEFQGGLRRGQARVFVLWTRAETPQGVVINLDSPASDPLGRSGLSGAVHTHFWTRFGGALLLTVVDGAIKGGVAALSKSGTSNIQTGDTESIVAETLRDSANIPPTLRKNQGELVSIFVARDLDFSSVYRVQPTVQPQIQPALTGAGTGL